MLDETEAVVEATDSPSADSASSGTGSFFGISKVRISPLEMCCVPAGSSARPARFRPGPRPVPGPGLRGWRALSSSDSSERAGFSDSSGYVGSGSEVGFLNRVGSLPATYS